jgi:S-adenosylmethionine-diacylgycerolhomoserine-N-methlytransferase
MGLVNDLKTMWHAMTFRQSGRTHAERLESYYHSQARTYDEFRAQLLHGRPELIRQVSFPPGGRAVDLGGGTGSNLELLGDRLALLEEVILVDLCPAMLAQARQRIQRRGWRNVHAVEADASTYEPPHGPVDLVLFSYSLTMMPDWFAAIDQAYRMLRGGGQIAVTDFYVSRKWPAEDRTRHSFFRRVYWPAWFSWHNVFLSPDHLPYLQGRFRTEYLAERLGKVPYQFGVRAPYYVFLGRKL